MGAMERQAGNNNNNNKKWLPKIYNRLIRENSPNLVTLFESQRKGTASVQASTENINST
jgi:hypothetical protein